MKTQLLSLALIMSAAPVWAASFNGLPNFHQVNDAVYRGGQPTDEGWQSLAKMGVKTVIDLRRVDEHPTTLEQQAVTAAGMRYINIPMQGIVAPPDSVIAKILSLFDSAGPVFVHCKRGADRTGAVIACYRISHDHWDRERALREAKSYGMSWMQFGLKQYVKAFEPGADRPGVNPPVVPAVQIP